VTRVQWVISRICVITLGVGWVLGWATAETVLSEPDLLDLPWLQTLVGCLIAGWGGATATLSRYLTAEYANLPFILRLEALKDFAVSVVVGAGSYWAGAWYELPAALLGIVILLSGYLGVALLTKAADKLLRVIDKIFNV
jgi:hypothetical protein